MRKLVNLLAAGLICSGSYPAQARHHPTNIERVQPLFDPATFGPYPSEQRVIVRHHRHHKAGRTVRHHRTDLRATRHRHTDKVGRHDKTKPHRLGGGAVTIAHSPFDEAGFAVAKTVSKVIQTLEVIALTNTGGMNRAFVAKLTTAFAANPDRCHVGSGFRSHAQQAALYRSRPRLAARPGHSNHEKGLAADIHCNGRGLAWLHSHAKAYALRFPMSYEPWHIEPAGLSSHRYASHEHHRHYAHHHRVHVASR